MKMGRSAILITLSIILILSSCVSRKKLTYLQYTDQSAGSKISEDYAMTSMTPPAYKVMPNDNLFIRVITPDPQWSELFNIQSGEAGITQESAGLSSYPVGLDGYIDMPYIGRVNVAGKTITDIKSSLDTIFKNYVTDAAITIRLVDSYLSIIGEVNSPGRYPITKDRLNVFEALSMAGDMSVYSNRQKVQLIRPSPYGPIVKEFSLSDRSILTSEFYYIMPNDIIYAVPMQGKAFQLNSAIYSLFFTSISTALVIISYFRTL